jgi:hypothetical protein
LARRGTFSKLVAVGALLAGFACSALPGAPAFGQQQPTAVDTSSPIVVKQTKTKPVWLKAQVVHGDRQTLTVREVDHPMNIHTFTYSPKAQDQMNNALDAGGYHRGDVSKVSYQPGQTVALAIKGKPSRQ